MCRITRRPKHCMEATRFEHYLGIRVNSTHPSCCRGLGQKSSSYQMAADLVDR